MRIAYVIFVVVLLSNLGFGQPLGSEKNGGGNGIAGKKVSSVQTDTSRINKLFDLYYQYRKVDISVALTYLQQAQSLAYNFNYPDKVALIQYHKGYLYRLQGNYHLAIRSYLASLNYYTSVSDEYQVAWLLIDIGNLYYVQSDKLLLAKEHFEKARQMFFKMKDAQGYALAENNIGMTLLKMNRWQEALPRFFSSIQSSEQIKDTDEKVLSLYYIAEAYQQGGKLDSALKYIQYSFKICLEKNMTERIAFGYEHWASLDTSKANYEQAVKHYELAYGKYQELNDPLNSSLVLNKISALYGKMRQYEKAISYSIRANNMAAEHNLISASQEILPLLSSFYAEKKDYQNAFLYLKQYQKLNESNAVSSLKKIQTEYETDIRFQEAALFKKQKELKDAQIYAQQILIIFTITGSIVFLVLFIFILIRSRQLKKSYEMLFKHAQERVRKEKEIQEMKEMKEIKENPKKEKYAGSLLSEESNQILYTNLLELMEQEKIYLNNKLTIDEVAKRLMTNRSYLSQMINDKFKTNFNNFINEYRVKEAQRLLLENNTNNYSIEGVSISVGFNSKSTFNAAFKKFTGIRPSEFIQLKKKQNTEVIDAEPESEVEDEYMHSA
jgi:AraC-like DNA-binding protein